MIISCRGENQNGIFLFLPILIPRLLTLKKYFFFLISIPRLYDFENKFFVFFNFDSDFMVSNFPKFLILKFELYKYLLGFPISAKNIFDFCWTYFVLHFRKLYIYVYTNMFIYNFWDFWKVFKIFRFFS